MTADRKVAVVAGVGPGNGAALARRFAQAGHAVAMLARTRNSLDPLEREIEGARGFECDVASAESVTRAFTSIRAELGPVDALLYNAGSGVFADVESITAEQFEQSWRTNAYGAFLCARQVIPDMRSRRSGSIVFIGATASRRGGPRTAAFAPAKAAQRSLAESMARTLWPAGIHVSLIIVDGVVDLPRIRQMMPDKPDSFFVKPSGVAETAYRLTCQDPSAWSFEVEARPFAESW
ncbi:MAG TPA: SDR family NAD(P)-dependent oxidoreductase [Steroidobacteraceae bacterium]|nr:SDR family NAD(P)-dependent oxidoreductase [Steroidobacteraceae bacterium]